MPIALLNKQLHLRNRHETAQKEAAMDEKKARFPGGDMLPLLMSRRADMQCSPPFSPGLGLAIVGFDSPPFSCVGDRFRFRTAMDCGPVSFQHMR